MHMMASLLAGSGRVRGGGSITETLSREDVSLSDERLLACSGSVTRRQRDGLVTEMWCCCG